VAADPLTAKTVVTEAPGAEVEVAAADAAAPAVPAPHPGPTPRPHAPVASGVPSPPPAAPAPDEDRSQDAVWGRVDDEGGVWVRTGEGERHVGSYPGASNDEALAYFGRKYDELAGQVNLLDQRIRNTEMPAKEALASVNKLRDSIVEANVVGDIAELLRRLQALLTLIEERRVEQDRARSRARAEAKALKDRIVGEAEQLAATTTWKVSGDRLRTLLDEWKAAPRLDRKTDDDLWKRFSAARTAFDKTRRQHFAALDEQRDEARTRKEKLVKEAESLSTSTEWGPTAARYRQLMTDWKAAGRAARGVEDELWEKFRAAQDAFFGARNALFAERDADQRDNLTKKESLAEEAERLLPITDYKAARSTLRSIQERWEAIGHVPRDARDRVEGRLRKVEESARSAEDNEWKRTNPAARARAEETVSQLRSTIASLEADAAKARAAGNERKATDAENAAAARREWLVEAEKTLAEFS
jgi:hypothetical protein